ncbi:MAG TPA: response regulator [Verrucomicrobiae bacterium]|jgi:FixJ family two-component response regulator|nr:response regulator [Verrucomicrobiae bacterium]
MPTTPRDSAAVFVIDDDASFLKSVSRLLSAVGYRVQSFGSAETFLGQLSAEMAGCIVADLQMPGMDGLKLQQALAKTSNPLPIIFLTGQGDIPTSVSAMRSGAEDFLTKRAPKEDLMAAIERALERDRVERQERGRMKDLRHRFDDLSERELEVLGHVVRGKMNKEIAADLNINERTVKLHRTNITRKLRVHSVAELTRLADEARLFQQAGSRSQQSGGPGDLP